MLADRELQQLFDHLGVSDEGRLLVEQARQKSPTRRVSGRAGNMTIRHPSKKMGFVIQAESRRAEYAGVIEYEFDDDVLEVYDQPPKIPLLYQTKTGRNQTVWSTPDYLVIRNGSITWEEWKTEKWLKRQAVESPNRFVLDADGQWHCPPGEEFAATMGMAYRLRSSGRVNWVYLDNLKFLETYRDPNYPAIQADTIAAIFQMIDSAEPGITLLALLNALINTATADDVYALIAQGKLYVDLHNERLAEPMHTHVFRDREMARQHPSLPQGAPSPLRSPTVYNIGIGATVVWDGQPWLVVNRGIKTTSLLREDKDLTEIPNEKFESLVHNGTIIAPEQTETTEVDEGQHIWNSASPEEREIALARYQAIADELDTPVQFEMGGQEKSPKKSLQRSRRSKDRYKAAFRAAEEKYHFGLVGVLNQYKGNRCSRLSKELLKFTDDYIGVKFENKKRRNVESVYRSYKLECAANGHKPVSPKKFRSMVKARPRDVAVEKREGKRAAYPFRFPWELTQDTPRHGDRPWQACHLDHTQLDIELIDPVTGQNLGRPWASFLSDAFSRRLLVIYLSFESPSYRACMTVIRLCVKRFGRLPETLVVDGGREFHSTYFETLLARYHVTKAERPWAEPHFGSTCERLFGTVNTQFIYDLTGNTQITKRVRLMTKAVDPSRLAEWTLAELYAGLCIWGHEFYDRRSHPSLNQSPRDAFDRGLFLTGERRNTLIPYSHDFVIDTMPTTRKGKSKVQIQGVKINHFYYTCDEFRDWTIQGTTVPVRYDPDDVGIAYGYVNKHWVECQSDYYAILKGRSELEMGIATEELRASKRAHSGKADVSDRELAEFLESLEGRNVTATQRCRDAGQHEIAWLTDVIFDTLKKHRAIGEGAADQPATSKGHTASELNDKSGGQEMVGEPSHANSESDNGSDESDVIDKRTQLKQFRVS